MKCGVCCFSDNVKQINSVLVMQKCIYLKRSQCGRSYIILTESFLSRLVMLLLRPSGLFSIYAWLFCMHWFLNSKFIDQILYLYCSFTTDHVFITKQLQKIYNWLNNNNVQAPLESGNKQYIIARLDQMSQAHLAKNKCHRQI